MYGDDDARDCMHVFNNWQEVLDSSVGDQSRILEFLKASERYDLAVEWTKLHVIFQLSSLSLTLSPLAHSSFVQFQRSPLL